jgi:hypothetical protein
MARAATLKLNVGMVGKLNGFCNVKAPPVPDGGAGGFALALLDDLSPILDGVEGGEEGGEVRMDSIISGQRLSVRMCLWKLVLFTGKDVGGGGGVD